MADLKPVILCLTEGGEALAARIAPVIGGVIHGRADRTGAQITFDETTSHIRDLFASGRTIIGICAAGILIRSVAPLLSDKHSEPAVIAVAEDGSAVVPLLGGHHGANAISRQIAEILQISPAVTTASDVVHGVALDEPPAGWRLTDAGPVGAVAAALLSGEKAHCFGLNAHLEPLAELPNVSTGTFVSVTGHRMPPVGLAILGNNERPDPDRTLCYERTQFVLGVGCARDCPSEELRSLVRAGLEAAGLPDAAIAGIGSLDLKADEAAILDLARELDVPFRVFPAAELEEETPRLANPSDVVYAEVGCHGVAEAAALRAAGPDAELIVEKQKTTNATVAIARAPAPITELPGRPRGQVCLVGLGPGRADWRTPEASRLVVEADELVGYGFYIDLLGPLAKGKPRIDFPLGGEEDRCRYALEEAAKGRNIAIICSGDAGIYAMGALVYELMSREEHGVSDAARRVEVVTAPGVTAMQAAAARIGAPLGHDFCAISLSDLLTPREDIEKRIQAAAEGDFVISFYNPVSKRRRELFVNAIQTLSAHRPPDTPVVLARSLGRAEEDLQIRRLDNVSVEDVDMMTVVIVGSKHSQTVHVGGRKRIFTPRGYANKSVASEGSC